ncbi:hypothetical protein LCGC14_0526950 [marine sediment metagenome]|uniref:Diphthamide synthase domain-containing protein n=1 Tax=marine sediment metagenome TaxID=412755 RepID=A0A0F9V4Z8_9ZZZZ
MKKVLFSWSGGKDSALALYEIQKDPAYEVVALLTTVTEDYDRVSMHGFRTELLVAQAASLSLPLKQIKISKDATNDDYENRMRESLTQFQNDGVLSVVFGDIFLEDLKKYREDKLAQVDMGAIFPLWKKDTKELANKFINTGFKALITCVDTNVLDARFTGRDYDTDLLNDLPAGVDPCGENGEFHTFVYDGPIFKEPLGFERGEVVLREKRFSFCDLLSATVVETKA